MGETKNDAENVAETPPPYRWGRGRDKGIPGASVDDFLAECRADKERELAIEKRQEEESAKYRKAPVLESKKYILDACAILALFNDEAGADVVSGLFDRARGGEITLYMHAANVIEVYYDRIRKVGPDRADAHIHDIHNDYPITIIEKLDPTTVRKASYFKAPGKMSFADTILVATAQCIGATIVTCDHAELEPVEQQEGIPFLWIRD